MPLDRLLLWLPLAVLGALLVIARLRALAMRRRGLRVMVDDHERPLADRIYDALLVAVFLFWVVLLLAEAVPLSLDWLPDWLAMRLVDVLALKLFGAALLIAAPVLFAAALRGMDASWRMGIDRQSPGPLVTTGLFARSRNPIYTAFDLIFLGAFLLHGRVIFLLLAVALALLLHGIIRREERFLAAHFGDEFGAYCNRAGRYSPWA